MPTAPLLKPQLDSPHNTRDPPLPSYSNTSQTAQQHLSRIHLLYSLPIRSQLEKKSVG